MLFNYHLNSFEIPTGSGSGGDGSGGSGGVGGNGGGESGCGIDGGGRRLLKGIFTSKKHQRTMVQNGLMSQHLITHFPTSTVSEQARE